MGIAPTATQRQGIGTLMFKRKILKKSGVLILLGLIVYFSAAYALMTHFGISCVFLEIFGLPCPGCGMTRALFSLCRLDFYSAFRYNPVIFFMPYVFAYVIFDFKHRLHNVALSAVAVVALVNWFIKLSTFF